MLLICLFGFVAAVVGLGATVTFTVAGLVEFVVIVTIMIVTVVIVVVAVVVVVNKQPPTTNRSEHKQASLTTGDAVWPSPASGT